MRSQKGSKFINIKIKTLNHSIFEIFANPAQPIFTIQGQIEQKTSVPVAAQRLLYRGINLETTRSFSNYDIGENNIISLVANKLPSQLSQSSSIRRSQINKIKSLNKQHLKYKKHMLLQQRSGGFKLQVDESLEVLSQNKHVIDRLLEVLNYNYAQESMPFKLDKRKMKVGEWVDVRDVSGVWSEGQVVVMYNEYVKVHYNGWPERMNEWIPQNSQRIMPFRSHTVQNESSPYLSPIPKYEATLTKQNNPNFQPQIQSFINDIQSTLGNFTKLLKQLQLQDKQSHTENNDYMMLIESQGHHHYHNSSGNQHQNEHEHENEHQNYNDSMETKNLTQSNNNDHPDHLLESTIMMKDIDYEVEMDKKQEFYTPSKEIRANDNLSNKAQDDVVSKCDKDDISNKSNKSFKSKRSQGLVDTQSMKSLIIDEKKRSSNIFFDSTQAQSVKSVKNHSKYHYLGNSNNHQQYEYIIEESDSQVNDREDKDNNENYLSFRKKQYKRKMKASQLAPLSDRLGRLLVDLAPHFAMLGYQEQGINNFSQNLSTFTNEGSLQSKLAKAQRKIIQQQEQHNTQGKQQQNKVYYSQSPYCQFQIPVMLTPNEITRLTKLLEQEKRFNQAQL